MMFLKPSRGFRIFGAALSGFLMLWTGLGLAATREEILPILQMVDYIGVDYPECVRDGSVLNASEYAEQREFSVDVVRRIAALPESSGKAGLVDGARALQTAIADKAPGQRIQNLTAQMTQALLAHYPIAITPAKTPDPQRGDALFQMQCASCHGEKATVTGLLRRRSNHGPPTSTTSRGATSAVC